MTSNVFELQVGYHSDKSIPYQRIICDTDFSNVFYEVNNDGKTEYSKIPPKHRLVEVEDVCRNIDLVLEVARLNYEHNKMIATIRDGEIIIGDDIDIWNDIKVWNNGEFPKKQNDRLGYVKHSYHNKYLRRGIDEVTMITDDLYYDGHVLHFEIESSTFQDSYTVVLMGYDRLRFEMTDGFHGNYHGYRYFDSWSGVQDWFSERYGVRLFKKEATVFHRC